LNNANEDKKIALAKQIIQNLNKAIKEHIIFDTEPSKFDQSGYLNIREGYIDKKSIKRAIIILRGLGCEWARNTQGCCSMCGHLSASSNGNPVSFDSLAEQFDRALEQCEFNNISMLCTYNGGSFLNDNEFPKAFRAYIYKRVNEKKIKRFVIESRVEYITNEKLDEIEVSLPETIVEIGVGIESSNDIVRNVLINKNTERNQYIHIGNLIKKRVQIKLLSYVFLKPPFLTEQEAINDAIDSVRFAKEIGSDIISLEAASIQEHTLLDYLAHSINYKPPWIWSVFEVINQVYDSDRIIRIGGFEFYPIPLHYTSNSCQCDEELYHRISMYNQTNNIDYIKNFTCASGCYKLWKKELENVNKEELLDRIISFKSHLEKFHS